MGQLHEIPLSISAELEFIPDAGTVPDAVSLDQEVPDFFRFRGRFPDLAGRCSREIAAEGKHFEALLELVLLQREEILRLERLLVQEMISGRNLLRTCSFGGSGFGISESELERVFGNSFPGNPGDYYRVRLYFPEQGNAVYAYAVLDEAAESGTVRHFSFTRLRPEDEDAIVEMVFARERDFLRKRSDARVREQEDRQRKPC